MHHVMIVHALLMGCTHLTSFLVAPEVIFLAKHHGYSVVSQVTYTDEGAPYALTEKGLLKREDVIQKFKDGRPIVQFVIKELTVEIEKNQSAIVGQAEPEKLKMNH